MITRSYQILLLILLLLQGNLQAQAPKDSYSSSSALSSGQWFKIAVVQDGIYRIDYSKLKQVGLTDPSNPKVFGNNFGMLSYYNDDPKPDDLNEISIYENKGSDGIFNEGDYLLFFGQGTGRWKFNNSTGEYDFLHHNYSDTACYFITSGGASGKKITDAVQPAALPGYYSSVSDALYIHEQEIENLLKSGREWYQPVSSISSIAIDPGFSDILTDQKMKTRIRVLARSPVSSLFRFSEGTTIHQSIQVDAVNMLNYTGTYAQITDSTGSSFPVSSSPSFSVSFYNNGEPGAKGWIDFVKIQCRKNNIFSGKTSYYSDSKVAGAGHITQFTIKSPDSSPIVWDITDPGKPYRIQYSKAGDNLVFKASNDSIKSYVLFNESNSLEPLFLPGMVPNQDLHGSVPADMIIVTHPLFVKYAQKLAGMHLANSGLTSLIVTPGQIYNEFSGGTADISAIRNFIRMKYMEQKGTDHPLKYLLLFGDGSYENRTPPTKNPDFIPTYQSQNSNVVVSSFTSDDFYGLLENGEGEADDGTLDIGIGRLPVNDTAQAGIVIRKIARYMSPSNKGDWKNIICITADDEDGNAHAYDAEGLSAELKDSVPVFNIDKIYLDAYRQVTTANGQTYPDVEAAINNRINAGCLIFNYIGHGNETGLAHERVVKTEDINSWKNGTKLPLFITATCEFSRFDDGELNIISREIKEKTSAGEMVLLNENGGGIALMSTTRVVYSAPNYFLNRNIYNYAFRVDSSGNALRLGDIIRLAKNSSGGGSNKRNFTLLGDPAVRLAFPWHGNVVTDSINHSAVAFGTDSLKALSLMTISGHIEDYHGKPMNDFSGTVSPLVYDKTSEISTLANDGGLKMKFELRNNILFSGKTTASEGRFRFSFIVPRDIDYTYGKGKISYYANNADEDMNGYFSDIIVGGFESTALADKAGPGIRLFMNDTLFRNGGITDENPTLLALISDSGGINTTGSGIGHDLTAYIDHDRNNSIVLNNYFENDLDNYMKGKLLYNLINLDLGNHSLTLKAWDNYNNSAEETIHFLVETGGKFILKNLMNYPNPVSYDTKFTAEQNRPDQEMEVTITIYDLGGRAIRVIETTVFASGYDIPPVPWDGSIEGGKRAGRGIYPYRITVKTSSGEKAEGSGRLIIL
jgi:hypothetical protein